jgi:hypothetical protein
VSVLSGAASRGVWGFKLRHLGIIVILVMSILGGLYLFTIQSDAYQEAEHFALTNSEVIQLTGPVSEVRFKFLSGFHVTSSGSGGEASFVFSLKGEKEESILDVRMARTANSWDVVEAYLSTKNQKGIPIKLKPGTSSAYLNFRPESFHYAISTRTASPMPTTSPRNSRR